MDGNERCRLECQDLLRHYKKAIKETKVLWWRNFVRFVGNADPWGAVYKLCRREKNEGWRYGTVIEKGKLGRIRWRYF